ncbi:MAG: protein-L-isoaspartate(D-aspartate) O-methyltransferase [Calditrichia bacterium]|nr:protein-L-isoaspartate(D-aspartate) O-methyltransferase [Calditrichota bacterium]MCB0268632.1 protein-L-isoaspartate(D-aspartate) O-methyltransferase [Calditrichota bacterium]MCB0288309.1 protein-L-isoaspartate(D-aspartate) O-methyltransferase [Calditrichota bacterium]MCB9069549.1 protein-L-isoaspartate(D-aspartate) O-methyltransferase [Calditrichia bacterium]
MYDRHREMMVQKYVIDAGITDARVIAAMRKIPRHLFVETAIRHQAYMDKSLPIGFGQTISHPTTVASMTQLLALNGSEKILEIGTGSGYQAAVLAEVGVKVYTIERIAELARRAQQMFDQLGYYTIGIRIGDGSVGWSNHAPYDRIIVTAASPEVPQTLAKQLGENGKLIVPVGDKVQQKLMIVTRQGNNFDIIEADSRSFVPLIGKRGWAD